MVIPVSGKNLFPSNISGLPTWYIVRLSEKGYQAPGDRTHIQVLVNPVLDYTHSFPFVFIISEIFAIKIESFVNISSSSLPSSNSLL